VAVKAEGASQCFVMLHPARGAHVDHSHVAGQSTYAPRRRVPRSFDLGTSVKRIFHVVCCSGVRKSVLLTRTECSIVNIKCIFNVYFNMLMVLCL
jgi:hypothetical protein